MPRSSRVRKKSSKLADFESPDEIDIPYKKKRSPAKAAQKIVPPKIEESDVDDSDSDDSDSDLDMKDDFVGFEEDWGENVDPGDMLDDEFDNDGNLQVDEDPASKDDLNYSQATSLYLSEKKKGALKEQKNIKRKKVERKDKGKARFTAYMLYARAIRPKVVEDNPLMDFATVNKRLGDMWSHVPYTQKHNWKRKAKQMEARDDSLKSGNTMITTGKRERAATSTPKANIIAKGKLQTIYQGKGGGKGQNKAQPLAQNTSLNASKPAYTPKRGSVAHVVPESSPPAAFKVTGTSPIDVAAHLKLLGESLNNIGQKLKEHEGQIAVSGSLSVLLDSMLCVLGPLACLTNQLEETRGAISDQTLANMLDNIAYIMPGIV